MLDYVVSDLEIRENNYRNVYKQVILSLNSDFWYKSQISHLQLGLAAMRALLMIKMVVFEPGQKAIYQEDGARAIVEVIETNVDGNTQRYKLMVTQPLNTSNPHFVGPEGGDKRAIKAGSFVRGFRQGQELNVSKNLGAAGTCWGMWTLTNIVEDASQE